MFQSITHYWTPNDIDFLGCFMDIELMEILRHAEVEHLPNAYSQDINERQWSHWVSSVQDELALRWYCNAN